MAISLILGPLFVICAGVVGVWIGRIIGHRIANQRDRARKLAAEHRPSPASIERLQREIDEPLDDYVRRHVDHALALTPTVRQQPMRNDFPAVCLTKNCAGDTDEVHTWGGQLAYRTHTCRRPA